ncbi:glycosyltransferase family 4 protein [Methylorubrum aminovorans]
MKLAIDGGAFQQGIAAGIFNVGVGLMNAIVRIRPNVRFVLVIDPRLGPVQEHLIRRLSFEPEIVEGEIGLVYGNIRQSLMTTDPDIRFEVDGVITPAVLTDGEATYEGPPPVRSFRILSCADRPSLTRGGRDERILGIKIERITIQSGSRLICIPLNHPRIGRGFYELEEGARRWTNGAAELPRDLFYGGSDIDVKVTIGVASTMTYRLASGLFDTTTFQLASRLEQLSVRTAVAAVQRKLISLGVNGYLANHFLPVHFPGLVNYAFLHDVLPILYPEFFMADARENFAHNMAVFRSANHVFSNSDASRQDLIRVGGVPPDRITTVSLAIDEAFVPKSRLDVEATLSSHNIGTRPYILTVGTLEPRKNHSRLIDAFLELLNSGNSSCDLVLVGKYGWGTENLINKIHHLGIAEHVHLLSGVNNEQLASLYSGALFAAYPSLYEGFGLPVLEAMACGCPVLTSNRASMPEISGEAALLVDPTDIASITQGLYQMFTNRELRQRLSDLGLKRSRSFSWDRTAERVLKVIEAA